MFLLDEIREDINFYEEKEKNFLLMKKDQKDLKKNCIIQNFIIFE